MKKEYFNMTRKELLALDNYLPEKEQIIEGIIVVPTDDIHDSGYRCMKFILTCGNEIVGVVGGGSDVIHINGIGGYGKEPNYITRLVKAHDLRIDCLPKSKCLRLFSDEPIEIDNCFISDFIFYFKEDKK